jgi:LacI family transcriptional regulator
VCASSSSASRRVSSSPARRADDPAPRPRRIALLIGQEIGFCRRVLQGVHDYALTRGWVFHDAPPDVRVLRPLLAWKPDGIICSLFDAQVAHELGCCGLPVVNTVNAVGTWCGPMVDVDHRAVGRLAAEHLLERGLRNFGFYGSENAGCSVGREAGFKEYLAQAGFPVSACHVEYQPIPPLDASWSSLVEPVRKWLLALPKPVGVLASYDRPARHLADACRQLDIRVPDEVAILGVDDDEFECKLCRPPLSSVRSPAIQIGYEAAALLDRLMSGPPPSELQIAIAPAYVVARQSTETAAVADPEVSAALAWVRDHLAQEIGVDDVAEAVGTSRRTLERRFRHALNTSILGEIQRMRIERAKHLLAETDLKLSAIARQCGVGGAVRFAAVFKQVAGFPPSVFRRLASDHPVETAEPPASRSTP